MSASGVSLSFHHMSYHLLTLAAGRFFGLFVVLCLLFRFWCLLPVLQVSWDFIIPPRVQTSMTDPDLPIDPCFIRP